MRKFKGFTSILTLMLALSLVIGCAGPIAPAVASAEGYANDNKIPYKEGTDVGGPAGVERQFDVVDSPYYPYIDYYHAAPTDTLTILPNFKTQQQTTEWTCGPASVLMVLERYGKADALSDVDLVQYRQKDEPGATNLRQMINILDAIGGFDVYSTYDLEDPKAVPENLILDSLKQGAPVIVGSDEWGGHWQVVIGYDTLGTEYTADDVLILADPYDTTDHNQDGFVVQSFQRLYYNWINSFDPDFNRNLFLIATPTSEARHTRAQTESPPAQTVVVGTSGAFAPFCYTDESGNLTGYDVEVLRAIDAKLEDVAFDIRTYDFDGLFIGLDAGSLDLITHQLGKNAERESKYLYAGEPLGFTSMSIVTRAADTGINSVEDLQGKTVLVTTTGIPNTFLAKYNEGIGDAGEKIKLAYYEGDWVQGMQNVVNDTQYDASAAPAVNIDTAIEKLGLPVRKGATPLYTVDVFFIYRSDNTALRDKIDTVLKELKADGTLGKISMQFLGADYSKLGENE